MINRARASLALFSSTAAVAAVLIAGCGGSSSGGSGEPASLAPANSPVFIEATLKPTGELKSNIESLSENLAGISDPGALITEQLNSAMQKDDPSLSYETDIEPWLGEKGGLFLQRYDGQDFNGVGAILQTTDSAAAGDFVDKLAQTSSTPVKQDSYEGVDYTTSTDDGTTVGVVDDFMVVSEDVASFEAVVDASGGDSLSENQVYKDAIAGAPSGTLADVYVSVGGLIKSAGAQVDQQVLQFYNSIGFDFDNSAALASIVPGPDQIEIDATTDVGGGTSSASLTDFLGSFPADSFLAFATPDVGAQVKKVIDGLDRNGIPGEVPPGQLKGALGAAGVNLDQIASKIGDVGIFIEGSSGTSVGGGLVIDTDSPASATSILNQVKSFASRAGVSGFKSVQGGFTITDRANFGDQPVEVLAEGDRLVIAYGDRAAQQAASPSSGSTLQGSAAFDDAAKALGGTPIAGFLDIGSVLKLAESAGVTSGADYRQARPYLDKLDFAAIGSGSSGDQTTSKVIVTLKG